MMKFKMIEPAQKEKIIDLIGNGRTDEVFDILNNAAIENDFNIVILKNRWKELKHDKISGVIDQSSYILERNKVNKSILEYLSTLDDELSTRSFELKNKNCSLLYARNESPIELSIQDAISLCKYKLAFHGITLIGLFTGLTTKRLVQKVVDDEFKELILVIANPKNIPKTTKAYGQIIYSLGGSQIGELLKLNKIYENKVKLFITNEFIRYSASYIDCDTSKSGVIRVNFPLYGVLLEETPLTIIRQQTSPNLFNSFTKSAETLYKRTGNPITDYEEIIRFLETSA